MSKQYYSIRSGNNPNSDGLPLEDLVELFSRTYAVLEGDGYFAESFGYECVDMGHVNGKIIDPDLDILLALRKKYLWPVSQYAHSYSEDDLLDMIEFLYEHVSEPIDGTYHSHANCGMHWESFNQAKGKIVFREKINSVLNHYKNKFELSESGQILHKAEKGYEAIFEADIPTEDSKLASKINTAILRFRKHASTYEDRKIAVRDLADALEILRPKIKSVLTSQDENDLFNLANNFGIRHFNDKQKTNYEEGIWLSWMFYFYLSTIHVVLRRI